jgi:hypothetical protein
MKYHSAPLIPHKSALMSAPANLLAEEVCLPAALLKKSALEKIFHGCSATPMLAAYRWRRMVKRQ